MKTITICFISLFIFRIFGQESQTVTYHTIVQTNWVKPDANWRIVNGVTYHTTTSQLWATPLELKHLQGYNLYGNHVSYSIKVNRINDNTVFCDILKRQRGPQQWSDGGINDDSSPELVSQIMVLNYPYPEDLVSGLDLSCRCIRTTNYLAAEHRSFEAYDCGIQSTNLVADYSYKRVKETNSVSHASSASQ